MARREDYDIVLHATDQTSAAFASAQRGLASLNGAVGTLKGGVLGLAGVLIGGEIASFAKEAVSSLGDIGNSAKRVGVTTDALQALRFEAEQNGAAMADADAGLQKFADAASKAGTGSNYLTKVFQANNIALRDGAGVLRPATDLLQDYARLVANATSPQDKLRLSVEAFGRNAGPLMVETLEKIAREGIPELIAKAKELGVVAGKDLIDKADEIDKHWKQLAATFGTTFKGAVVQAADGIAFLLQGARELTRFSLGKVFGNFAVGSELLKNRAGTSLSKNDAAAFYDAFGKTFGNTPAGPATKLPLDNDAVQKAIDNIAKHIAQMKADALAVDASAGEHERLRVSMQLLEVAQQHGISTSGEYGKKITEISLAAKGAADALAVAMLQSDVFFERAQLGRTASEQTVAERLRSAQIPADSAQGEFLAQQIRINESLKDTKNLASDALKGIVADFRAGKSAGEIFANVLDKIATKIADLAIDSALSSVFKSSTTTGGIGSLFAGLGKLFGFAEGGEFKVGGTGGTDSQLVAFRASPDETVKVSRPGQGSRAGLSIVYAPTIDARGADAAAVARLAMIVAQDKKQLRSVIRDEVSKWRAGDPAALRA